MSQNLPQRRILSGRIVADFVVVLLGVFVALWADSWMNAREDRSVERTRLDALRANVDSKLAEVRAHIEEVEEDKRAVRELLTARSPTPDADPDSLREVTILVLLDYPDLFHAHLNVYEDLRSSGELALVEPDVRRSLTAVESALQGYVLARNDIMGVQHRLFDPYVVEAVDVVDLLVDGNGEARSGTDAAAGYSRLLGQHRFRNLAAFKFDLLNYLSGVAERVEEDLVSVRDAIDSRLAELQ